MKITIIGYGRIGKQIHEIAEQRGHEIALIIDENNTHELELVKNTDVAIDFSLPDTAKNNIEFCLKAGVPIVSGTTGWIDKLEKN